MQINTAIVRYVNTRVAALLAGVVLVFVLSGCAAISHREGRDFKKENLSEIKAGMGKEMVVNLLGDPYSVSRFRESGEEILEYRSVSIKTVTGGGLVVNTGVTSLSGSMAAIYIDKSQKVTKIIYEVFGGDLYEEHRKNK